MTIILKGKQSEIVMHFLSRFSLSMIFLVFSTSILGKEETIDEKKAKLLNFKSIKGLLKNDNLDRFVKEKKNKLERVVKKRVDKTKKSYRIPPDDEVWSFLTEYWLIRNVQKLKWDFKKPNYGIHKHFESFLEKMGFLEKKFKILVLDTPIVTHFSLPANKNEYIFLLSLPFMRTLDLTKQEISILLFEDFVRMNKGYFKDFVSVKTFKKYLGKTFKKGTFKKQEFLKVHSRYDQFIFKKGFNFQQQFDVTKIVINYLRGNSIYLTVYEKLLKKIEYLVKNKKNYSHYVKVYPSPELQLNWMKSEKIKL
jgi:hypothetical protein